MSVLRALRRTPGAIGRNPVLLLPVLVVSMLQLPQLLLRSTNPLLASLVSFAFSIGFILVLPLFQGGLVGMASEALDGHTSLETFLHEGKDNYVSLLLGYFLLLAVNFLFGIVAFVMLFVGLLAGVAGLADAGIAVLAVVGLLALLFGLAYLTVVFLVQFYAHAIVLDDEDVVDAFRESVGLVRANLASALGYTLLVGVAGALFGLVAAAMSILTSPEAARVFDLPQVSAPLLAGVALVIVLLSTVFGAFFATYSVAFYRELTA